MEGNPFFTLESSDHRYEHGGLRFCTVKSKALGRRVDFSLFIPEECVGATAVPNTVLLHGVYGSHWSWAFQGGAHQIAQRLISNQKIVPMVLVMPSDGLWGDGSGYLPHRDADYEQWIVSELLLACRAVVSQITEGSPTFIAGLSMGGYGALRLGAKYPKLFTAFSGLSAITRFEEFAQFLEPADMQALRSDSIECPDLAPLLLQDSRPRSPFRFDCGIDDPLLQGNRALHELLVEKGVEHVYEEFPGGHEWSYWNAHLGGTLEFFSKFC